MFSVSKVGDSNYVCTLSRFIGLNIKEYKGSEQQLVYRIVMNFHPSILAHAAFLNKQRFTVAKER